VATIVPLGGIIDPSRDRFPSSGPHGDFRVIPQFGDKQGQKIDPRTARSILKNVLVGKDRTPLVQQNEDGQWNWNYPITSGFGPRNTGIPGASTYHSGIDVGIPTGTPLAYQGNATYRAGDGMGTLSVKDDQGRPYNVQVLHIDPAASMSETPDSPSTPPSVSTDVYGDYPEIARERDIYQAYAQGLLDSKGGRRKRKSTKLSLKEQMARQLLGQVLNPLGTGQFLGGYLDSSPRLSQQSSDLFDYFSSYT